MVSLLKAHDLPVGRARDDVRPRQSLHVVPLLANSVHKSDAQLPELETRYVAVPASLQPPPVAAAS